MTELTDITDPRILEIAARVQECIDKAPNVSVQMDDGKAQLTIGKSSDADEQFKLMDAMGTYDLQFLSPLLGQIGNAVSVKDEVQESSMQFVIAFIKSIKPENEMEVMLAAQMAAVHVCAMDASRRYLWTSSLAGKDSAERALTKLTRTFTTQMEALKKNRAKAQQTVRVERVNVESRGQAIVGSVEHSQGSTGGGGAIS